MKHLSHPQSERTNQTAEIWIRHWNMLYPGKPWSDALAPMQATLNASVNASTGESPSKLMYGIKLRMPWDLFRNAFRTQEYAVRQDADEASSMRRCR